MRVLVTVQPLESHVRAIQQVVRTVRLLGHDVLLAAPEKVGPMIERSYDLPYVKAGEDWTHSPGIGERLTYALIEGGNSEFIRTIIEDYLTGPTAVAKADDLARIVAVWRPEAILCDCTDIGSLITAWQLDLPCISLDNGWSRPLTQEHESLAIGLRRNWPGLDADQYLTEHLPPVITPCPTDLVYPDIPFMRDYRVEHPQRLNAHLPRWVAELPSDLPLVYGSYGSILTQGGGFDQVIVPIYRRMIEALGQLRCMAVLSVGNENARRLTGPDLPPNVRIVARIDQPLLLQAGVDAILTPGGLGTVKELLTSAVSPVLVPLCSENFFMAERFVETGLGTSVAYSAEPVMIAEAVQTVLTDPSYRQTSREWQRRSLALPSLESVLTKLLP